MGRTKKVTNFLKKNKEDNISDDKILELDTTKSVISEINEKISQALETINIISSNEQTEPKTGSDNKKNIEWLEEQVVLLSEENKVLKERIKKLLDELELIRLAEKNKINVENPDVELENLKRKIIQLFNEVQVNYINLGKNLIIVPPAFLNRMILFFPFLENEKRF